MINKIVQSMAEAMTGIHNGSVVLVGGFGSIGQPNALIDGLIEQGAKDLTVVANNSGVGHVGLARLLETGRVRKIVCSFPRTADPVVFEGLYRAGKIELEIVRRAPAVRPFSPRPRSAPSSPKARSSARLPAANMCWKKRCPAMSRWLKPGRPTAGAT
jgi:hypothetical protein